MSCSLGFSMSIKIIAGGPCTNAWQSRLLNAFMTGGTVNNNNRPQFFSHSASPITQRYLYDSPLAVPPWTGLEPGTAMSPTTNTTSVVPPKSRRGPTNKVAKQVWSTARCHRLIRPLVAKLQALNNITQSAPSTTATAGAPKPSKIDPGELNYKPELDGKTRRRKDAAGSTSERDAFFGNGGKRRVKYTYGRRTTSGAGGGVGASGPRTSGGSAIAPFEEESTFKEPCLSSIPQQLLDSLRPFVHASIFSIYTGICTAFDSLLLQTTTPPPPPSSRITASSGPQHLSLKSLAARQVAHCILATSTELSGQDDAWYDAASEIGVSGEYLRTIVRWHGIELLREAIRFNFMPVQKNGLGLAGVLVGLCKQHKAEMEAESLLKSMFELRPLSTNPSSAAFATLKVFWEKDEADREALFRLLGDNMDIAAGTPVAFGNTVVNEYLKAAAKELEDGPSKRLVERAFESVFFIWGDRQAAVTRFQRQVRTRRKGARNSVIDRADLNNITSDVLPLENRSKIPPLPANVGKKAETMALNLAGTLIITAYKGSEAARDLLLNLARGFALQDIGAREVSEEAWETSYPIAARIFILAFAISSLSKTSDDPNFTPSLTRELARSLSDVKDVDGRAGLQSVGEYISKSLLPLYSSDSGRPILTPDPIKTLVTNLLPTPPSAAATLPPSIASSMTTPRRPAAENPDFSFPETPFTVQIPNKVITLTPKPVSSAREDSTAYYCSRLALHTALEFATLQNRPAWAAWAVTIESRVLGMKLRTPAPQPACVTELILPAPPKQPKFGAGNKERKGWRWEEGIAEWVAVGNTPGMGMRKVKQWRKRKDPVRMEMEISLPVLGEEERKNYVPVGHIPTSSPAPSEVDEEEGGERVAEDLMSEGRMEVDIALEFSEEGPDTSCSRIFDEDSDETADSATSDDGSENESDEEADKSAEIYRPTPRKPPVSVRKSPRSAAKMRARGLKAFGIKKPVFTRLSKVVESGGSEDDASGYEEMGVDDEIQVHSSSSDNDNNDDEDVESESDWPAPKSRITRRASLSHSRPKTTITTTKRDSRFPLPTRSSLPTAKKRPFLLSEESDQDAISPSSSSDEADEFVPTPPTRSRTHSPPAKKAKALPVRVSPRRKRLGEISANPMTHRSVTTRSGKRNVVISDSQESSEDELSMPMGKENKRRVSGGIMVGKSWKVGKVGGKVADGDGGGGGGVGVKGKGKERRLGSRGMWIQEKFLVRGGEVEGSEDELGF